MACSVLRSRVLLVTFLAIPCLILAQEKGTQPASPADSQSKAIDSASSPPTTPSLEQGKDAKEQKDPTAKDSSDRKTHLHLGTVSVGASYSHFSGWPYPYGHGPYGYYPYDGFSSALLWSPVWGPYYGPGYFSQNNGRGQVRLSAEPKNAQVYLNGGYAGTADELKSMWLDPGAYDLSVKADGRELFQQRIYVLSGKKLKIDAKPTEWKDKS